MVGLVCSLLGGMVIGFAYYLGVLMSSSHLDLNTAPNQLLLVLVGGLGGLLGSMLDSLIGEELLLSIEIFLVRLNVRR